MNLIEAISVLIFFCFILLVFAKIVGIFVQPQSNREKNHIYVMTLLTIFFTVIGVVMILGYGLFSILSKGFGPDPLTFISSQLTSPQFLSGLALYGIGVALGSFTETEKNQKQLLDAIKMKK